MGYRKANHPLYIAPNERICYTFEKKVLCFSPNHSVCLSVRVCEFIFYKIVFYFLTMFRDLESPFQNEQKLYYMQQVPTSKYLILILHFIVFYPMRN